MFIEFVTKIKKIMKRIDITKVEKLFFQYFKIKS